MTTQEKFTPRITDGQAANNNALLIDPGPPIGRRSRSLRAATAPGPASLWALSPLGRRGVRYMPMPDRLIRTLPGGELALLTVIGSTWRPRGKGLRFSAREFGEALGWCSRTLYSHLAVLRDRGLVHGERMEITAKAHPEKRERFGKLFAWIACQPGVTSEPFRTYARSTVQTDKKGRRRASWRWIGKHYGRSRQSIMTHVKALREAEVPLAIRVFKGGLTRTFTSLRNKARHLSGKKESRKKALSHDRFLTAQQPEPMSAEAFERERERQRGLIAGILRAEAGEQR